MNQKTSHVLRLLGAMFGIALVVSLIVIVIGWIFQWSQPVQFSNAFFAAGAIVIVFGTLSVAGGFEQRANFPIAYAESAGHASISERTQRMMSEINQRYGSFLLMVGSGLILIGISIAINTLF